MHTNNTFAHAFTIEFLRYVEHVMSLSIGRTVHLTTDERTRTNLHQRCIAHFYVVFLRFLFISFLFAVNNKAECRDCISVVQSFSRISLEILRSSNSENVEWCSVRERARLQILLLQKRKFSFCSIHLSLRHICFCFFIFFYFFIFVLQLASLNLLFEWHFFMIIFIQIFCCVRIDASYFTFCSFIFSSFLVFFTGEWIEPKKPDAS